MLISIIVAVYNVEKYIGWCLDSIINQTYKNIEIICINDGSTDSSLKILQEYAQSDTRIQIINQKNSGLAAARNTGMKYSKGEFILFVDGDDELKKNTIERAVAHIDDEIDAVWFEPEIFYQANAERRRGDEKYYSLKGDGKCKVSDQILLTGDVNAWNKLFRLSTIQKYRLEFPQGMLFEDAPFFYNFMSIARYIYLLREKLYVYYRRPSSIMAQIFQKKENYSIYHIFILDNIYDFWMKNNLMRFRKYLFQRICIQYYENAMRSVPDFEKARVVWEMTKRIRKWNLECTEDYKLNIIKEGYYKIIL